MLAETTEDIATMSASRLALIAEDQRLTQALQVLVKKVYGHAPTPYRYETVRKQTTWRDGTLLVLTTGSAKESEEVERVVQDLQILQAPVQLVVVESENARIERSLSFLEPYLLRRVSWPEQAEVLADLLRGLPIVHHSLEGGYEGSLEDSIRERLQTQTPSLVPMTDRLALAASHDVTVLLTGETGTGKTYLARLLHDHSPRARHRFLVVPCGALSPNLVESEFFGHSKGAFTSADRPKVGKFAAAGEGTLLLDEIDALGLEQQANLLRVIETGEYEPVGSNETQVSTARIIVASNWNLEEAVEEGKFRGDLYYRLNVMSFHLPPLRERVEDIAPLVRGMTARFNHKFRKNLFEITPEAMACLKAYNWPGNIRQLENVLQQAILVSSGPRLQLQHLPKLIQEASTVRAVEERSTRESLASNREVLERNVIHRALVNCGYSRARAAHALGISRVTLYKKMKKYDLMAVPLNPGQAR